ncbi:MAG: chalcone isomerase family protein [Candidatus Thiodiazotropha sp.]
MMHRLMMLLLCLPAIHVSAQQLAGIELSERYMREADQRALQLNGAGIREKFFFDIYLIALYVEQPQQRVETLLQNPAPVHIDMFILYSEISQEKFADGWEEGFVANLTQKELRAVRDRLDRFKAMFGTLHAGDRIGLDFIPAQGTRVRIQDQDQGLIPGWDFFQALLKVWLGDEPVSDSLKSELLGSH